MEMVVAVRKISLVLDSYALSQGYYGNLKIETRLVGEELKVCRDYSGILSVNVKVVCERYTIARYLKITNGKIGLFYLRTVSVQGTV